MATPTSDAKTGIVAILDALGVSTYDIEKCKGFVEKRDSLLAAVENIIAQLGQLAPEVEPPQIRTFQDTIVFHWNTGASKMTRMLPGAAHWVMQTVGLGVQYGVLLRGALAVGDYLVRPDTILGPAVADAAAWYEEANWFGAIATPACQFRIIENAETFAKETAEPLTQWFVQYNVPLRNGRQKAMWALSWPCWVWYPHGEKARLMLASQLQKYPMPKGTEEKYENGLAFFDWYLEKVAPDLSRAKVLGSAMPGKDEEGAGE